jgi:Tfp pilus assembly protein PilF
VKEGEEEPPALRTFYLPPLEAFVRDADREEREAVVSGVPYLQPSVSFPSSKSLKNKAALPGRPALYAYQSQDEEEAEIDLREIATEEPVEGAPEAANIPPLASLLKMRLTSPRQAKRTLRSALARQPENIALQNLLGITYLEGGNRAAAKVVWLSLMSRNLKNAALLNNLGAIAVLEDRPDDARDLFQRAIKEGGKDGGSREAGLNLGQLYLKYHDGKAAREAFEEVLSHYGDDQLAQAGLAVAMAQQGAVKAAIDRLAALVEKDPDDPYYALSLAYLLMDSDKRYAEARAVLSGFLERHPERNERQLKAALREAGQAFISKK